MNFYIIEMTLWGEIVNYDIMLDIMKAAKNLLRGLIWVKQN